MSPPSDGTPDLDALSRELAAAYDLREDCKQRLADADQEYKRLEQELASLLEASGTGSLRTERWLLAPKRTVNWKVPPSGKDDALRLIRQGAPELIKETVNPMSLSGYLRREEAKLEAEAPGWWVELKTLLERSEALSLSMRRK